LSLQNALPEFPGNRVYTYCGGSAFKITKDPEGNEVNSSWTIPGLRFRVIKNPFISGSAIRAMAKVWVYDQVYPGYVTLYDSRGYQAALVRQRERQNGFDVAKAIKNKGDSVAPVEITWGENWKELGRGAFAVVYKNTINVDGFGEPHVVAMKVPFRNQEAYDTLYDEMLVMQDIAKVAREDALVKESTVQLVEASLKPLFALAIEFSPYGDLMKHISQIRRVPSCFWRIIRQVSHVFKVMERLNHRDIKPENILLFPSPDGTQMNFKLGDFGLATNNGDQEIFAGTRGYLPPEASGKNGVVNRSADVFALGVTVLNMVLGDVRVEIISKKQCFKIICPEFISESVKTVINDYKALFNTDGAGAHLDLLESLLIMMTHPSPATRITFEEIDTVLHILDSTDYDKCSLA